MTVFSRVILVVSWEAGSSNSPPFSSHTFAWLILLYLESFTVSIYVQIPEFLGAPRIRITAQRLCANFCTALLFPDSFCSSIDIRSLFLFISVLMIQHLTHRICEFLHQCCDPTVRRLLRLFCLDSFLSGKLWVNFTILDSNPKEIYCCLWWSFQGRSITH